ncbi:hypothetical protein E7Z59_00285 [Robertkochia marina]|uniref:Uncharacterized protein n=1 Tax=Robertkochia marina TaxID=1227945 RepID=A0A4S3M3E5_9FLAO|nr:hypothetical protein [Robertkochia marina]THD68801.1 hypothetical protein E7Z59_00285 [Robertkochia marina]TRZ43875.1 hypothetical protein D3A96_09940 [Robertkochia marina]
MRYCAILLIVFGGFGSRAQESSAETLFRELQLEIWQIEEHLTDELADRSFNYSYLIIKEDDTTKYEANFDPRRPSEERWQLTAYNDSTPSKHHKKEFREFRTAPVERPHALIDTTRIAILENSETKLAIEFYYNKEELPEHLEYLKKCKGVAWFSKTSKHLERTEISNTAPLEFRLLPVHSFHRSVFFEPAGRDKTLLIKEEQTEIMADVFGRTTRVKEIKSYSNYEIISEGHK